jgi:hypothetical protein
VAQAGLDHDRLSVMERKLDNLIAMTTTLCSHLGITPSLIPGFSAAASADPMVPSSVTAPSLLTSANSNTRSEDEEPSRVPQSDSMLC